MKVDIIRVGFAGFRTESRNSVLRAEHGSLRLNNKFVVIRKKCFGKFAYYDVVDSREITGRFFF